MREIVITGETTIAGLKSSSAFPGLFFFGEPDKQAFEVWSAEGDKMGLIKLPALFPAPLEREKIPDYLSRFSGMKTHYLILIIQAGTAALGYVEEGRLIHHKHITRYMVRKKQGKAQITHLKTKGKSRAGSRIRLANSIRFFEEINQKLMDWDVIEKTEAILYHCSPSLFPFLFDSKVKPPFEKDDDRLIRVGVNIQKPGFDELERVRKAVDKGLIIALNAASPTFIRWMKEANGENIS